MFNVHRTDKQGNVTQMFIFLERVSFISTKNNKSHVYMDGGGIVVLEPSETKGLLKCLARHYGVSGTSRTVLNTATSPSLGKLNSEELLNQLRESE